MKKLKDEIKNLPKRPIKTLTNIDNDLNYYASPTIVNTKANIFS